MKAKFTRAEIEKYLIMLREMLLKAEVLSRTCDEPEKLHDLLDVAQGIPELVSVGTRDMRKHVLPGLKRFDEKYGDDYFMYLINENPDDWKTEEGG